MRKIIFLAFFLFIFQNAQAEKQKLSETYEREVLERGRQSCSLETASEKVKLLVCAAPLFVERNLNENRFSAQTSHLFHFYIYRVEFQGSSGIPDHGGNLGQLGIEIDYRCGGYFKVFAV